MPKSYSMRPDGKLIVDVNQLLSSERVKKDLDTLRKAVKRSETNEFAPESEKPVSPATR